MKKFQSFHLSASIEGLLKLKKINFLEDDQGKKISSDQAREELKRLRDLGHKYIKAQACDNWDPEKGCLGHESEE